MQMLENSSEKTINCVCFFILEFWRAIFLFFLSLFYINPLNKECFSTCFGN